MFVEGYIYSLSPGFYAGKGGGGSLLVCYVTMCVTPVLACMPPKISSLLGFYPTQWYDWEFADPPKTPASILFYAQATDSLGSPSNIVAIFKL